MQTYAVKNLKKGIAFLEQQFNVKWDWDAFWKNAEMYNESSRYMIEKWDVNCTNFPRSAAPLALQQGIRVHGRRLYGRIHAQDRPQGHQNDAEKGYEQDKAADANKPKYRLIVWACRPLLYQLHLLDAALLGCHLVNDMEAMLSYQPLPSGTRNRPLKIWFAAMKK